MISFLAQIQYLILLRFNQRRDLGRALRRDAGRGRRTTGDAPHLLGQPLLEPGDLRFKLHPLRMILADIAADFTQTGLGTSQFAFETLDDRVLLHIRR